MTNLYYTNQYVSTTLAEAGGIDDSQTSDITLQSVSGIETSKPGICCISYSDPIDTTKAEWVTYTSIDASKKLVGATRGQEGFAAKSHAFGATIAFPISKSHINNLNDALYQGWTAITETFTYASATTITIAAGGASRFQKGDKLKLTNNTVKYFYIVGVADTLLTVTGGSDYTLAVAAITSPQLSRIENPLGFPGKFAYTSNWSGTTTNPAIGDGTKNSNFSISGSRIFVEIALEMGASTTYGSGSWGLTMPISPSTEITMNAKGHVLVGSAFDLNTLNLVYIGATTGARIRFATGTVGPTLPFTWASGDTLYLTGSYTY